jgi:hypothetical protein
MSDQSKLMLSAEELQLAGNTHFILTKRIITDKVNVLLGQLAQIMQQKIILEKDNLPAEAIQSTPKIAKGENYLQLPYLMLDYPRCFDNKNVFAIRTMFWWGNFFSCTLHLSGSYKNRFSQALQKNTGVLQQSNFFVCINNNEWQHHFEEDNYVPLHTLTIEEINTILTAQHFVKVAAKFSLHQWSTIDVLLEKCFTDLLQLVK